MLITYPSIEVKGKKLTARVKKQSRLNIKVEDKENMPLMPPIELFLGNFHRHKSIRQLLWALFDLVFLSYISLSTSLAGYSFHVSYIAKPANGKCAYHCTTEAPSYVYLFFN